MAVFQISKIQVRRGKKNNGTGIPQLSSGEFAWSIDSQELFIGNGAVSEGAPYVGNTKILTEHDSLLDLVSEYQYKFNSESNGSTVAGTVPRTLQDRLDDGVVSARNFGIVPNLTTDQGPLIQSAINSVIGKTLEFENGNYVCGAKITLPTNTTIKGAGKNLTTFEFTVSSGVILDTNNVSSNSNISVSDIGIRIKEAIINAKVLRLYNLYNCNFNNISIVRLGASLPSISNNTGMELIGDSSLTFRNNNFFNIDIQNIEYPIVSNHEIFNNVFDRLYVYRAVLGLKFGEGLTGPLGNTIRNSMFESLTNNAILVNQGTGNIFTGNTFKNIPLTISPVKFLSSGNISSNEKFINSLALIDGISLRNSNTATKVELFSNVANVSIVNIPLNTSASRLEFAYIYFSTAYSQTRSGNFAITVDRIRNLIEFSDTYDYSGIAGQDTNVLFSGSITLINGVSHLTIRYTNTNPIPAGADTNYFTYNYSSMG